VRPQRFREQQVGVRGISFVDLELVSASSRRCQRRAPTSRLRPWLHTGQCRSSARARVGDRLRRTLCRRTIRRMPARPLGDELVQDGIGDLGFGCLDAIAHPCWRRDTFFLKKEPVLRKTHRIAILEDSRRGRLRWGSPRLCLSDVCVPST
jgi:hypothetical protein